MKLLVLFFFYFLFTVTVTADPVPANLKVFCFRITDIREDCSIPNRFYFEFEVLNWSHQYAGGIQLSFAHGSDQELTFAQESLFNGIDHDGRPLFLEDVNGDSAINNADMEDVNKNGKLDPEEDQNNNNRLDNDPAPGNLPTNNQWIRKSVTDSTIIWDMDSSTPVSYINLVQPKRNDDCIPKTMDRKVLDDGTIIPTEAIDNGLNVLDGFVMTIDGFEPGMIAHMNWFLLGAGDAKSPLQEDIPEDCVSSNDPHRPLGNVLASPYGNGMVSIARGEVAEGMPFPSPVYQGQTGFTQSTRDFFDSSYNVPNCPSPITVARQEHKRKLEGNTEFYLEFSPGLVANFCIGGDAPNGSGEPFAIPNGNVNSVCGGMATPTSPPNPTSTTLSPSVSPTTHITPWLIGPSMYTLNGGNNYFDGYLGVSNSIGLRADLSNVRVQLFDFSCVNKKDNMNSTNAVTIFATDTTQVQSFGYSVNISQSNIGDDTGEFIFPTGPSTGDVKFCTRVSTYEGSIEVAFRETNFILSFDLTKNTFDLKNIQIKQNNPDSFITDVDTAFSVLVYRCNNYAKVASPDPLNQDENLVVCLEPTHEENMAHVVHISNFNLKIFAGSLGNGNYVEYNPVWFSTGGWDHDSLTSVSEQADPADVIMISTPVIAQFFIQGHTTISVSGNCFFEFDSAKEARAPVFVDYDMQFDVIDIVEVACLDALLKRIRTMF